MPVPQAVDVDVKMSERRMWLVKVPAFVAKRWQAACAQSAAGSDQVGKELGIVRLDTSDPAQMSWSLSLNGPSAEGIPKEYALRSTKEGSVLHCFGEDANGVSISGRVEQRFDVEMQAAPGKDASELDPEYRRISRERNRLAATKTRIAQVIDTPNKFGAARNTQTYATKRKLEGREKKIVEKRVRMDKQPLESLLFRLFEKQDYWVFQNLVKETDQPVAWLKECLMEIAVQNKATGRHKDHWQLKSEYRTRDPVQLDP